MANKNTLTLEQLRETIDAQGAMLNGMANKGKHIGPSKGFKALDKLTDKQLQGIADTLRASYNFGGRGASAFSIAVGHSLPTTHCEAQYIALRMFKAKGTPSYEFANDSRWHSNAKNKPYLIDNKYSANREQKVGSWSLRCTSHKMRTRRGACSRECLQVFVNVNDGKTLYTSSTKRKFAFTGNVEPVKPTKRTKTAKTATQTVAPNPTTETSETVD